MSSADSAKRAASSMDASSAASSSSSAPASKRAHIMPRCPYGAKCYRKNRKNNPHSAAERCTDAHVESHLTLSVVSVSADHIRDFDHSDGAAAEADISKPHCPYGWQWSVETLLERSSDA